MNPWYEREGALERELAAFREHGYEIEVERGPPAFQDLVVRVHATVDERDFRLRVLYPDSYPYLRPYVLLEDDVFDRHQNPVDKNLCLLDRSTRAWRPSMTAASHIAEQLPKLVAILEMEPAQREDLEAPQGEPLSAFFKYQAGSVILVPEFATSLSATTGRGTIRLLDPGPSPAEVGLRGVLNTLTETKPDSKAARPLGKTNDELAARVRGPTLTMRWMRIALAAADLSGDGSAQRLVEIAQTQDPDAASFEYQDFAGVRVGVLGLVFQEELQLNTFGDSWVFLVSVVREGAPDLLYAARGERAGLPDLLARIPSLAALREKVVALIGLGSLGSPAALEFARAQLGELRVLDFDHVEFGTTVRWALGLDAVTYPKTTVVSGTVESNYPYVTVKAFPHMLGAPAGFGREPERALLGRLVDGADVVVDLTGERGINYLLSILSDAEGIPQVYGWGTEGGWGGGVARVIPGKTGCWFCLMLHLRDDIPPPPTDNAGTVQPPGCASVAYTGANFDLLPVVAQAVRLTVQTLASGSPDGYPDSHTDVMILALRDATGKPITPTWKEYPLTRHAKCPNCPAVSS